MVVPFLTPVAVKGVNGSLFESLNPTIFLSERKQFAKVAFHGKVISDRCWRLRYNPNNEQGARLGVSVPKRCVRLAVKRNRLRRIIRETFRQQWRLQLPAVDIIFRLNSTPPQNEQEIIQQCAQIFSEIKLTPTLDHKSKS
ncbi:MAG: ribonuclease P protein component [Gammaproteobacteria bacterium WSBS_2016_MAG_OTU1]